jgi:delta-aminolevulinic acid dehydratase/porphobilinogen synthase
MSIDEIVKECGELQKIGLNSIILFCYSWCKRFNW